MLEIVQPSSRLRRSRNLCVVRQRAVASAVRFRRAPIVQGLSRPAQEIRETAQEGPAVDRGRHDQRLEQARDRLSPAASGRPEARGLRQRIAGECMRPAAAQ